MADDTLDYASFKQPPFELSVRSLTSCYKNELKLLDKILNLWTIGANQLYFLNNKREFFMDKNSWLHANSTWNNDFTILQDIL